MHQIKLSLLVNMKNVFVCEHCLDMLTDNKTGLGRVWSEFVVVVIWSLEGAVDY